MHDSGSIFALPEVCSEKFPGITFVLGWHPPEYNMIWTKEKCAIFLISPILSECRLSASLTLASMGATQASPKKMIIKVGSSSIIEHVAFSDAPVTLTFKVPIFGKNEYGGEVEIITGSLGSPFEEGFSSDRRHLGLSLLDLNFVYHDKLFSKKMDSYSGYHNLSKVIKRKIKSKVIREA